MMNLPPKIRKAVFPVAGFGTRFLPATKASPKEMLPVVDKPLVQYAVEEAVAAGCTELIFITGRSKRSIEDHFDKAYELETELALRQKNELLAHVQSVLPANVHCTYIRQAEALGLGHAVLCAEPAIGNEPFAVILADDLIDAPQSVLSQMLETYNTLGSSVIGVQTIDHSQTESYGMVETLQWQNHQRIHHIIEKPKPEQTASNLAVVGRYILTPRIFALLESLGRGAGNEIQLTDAIAKLLEYEPVMAHAFAGARFDCGSKLGYLEATLSYGLKHPETAASMKTLLLRYAGVQPAPVAQMPVVQPDPVAETPVVQPAPVAETPVVQPAPVAQTPAVQPAPVAETPVVQAASAATPVQLVSAASAAAAISAPEPAAENEEEEWVAESAEETDLNAELPVSQEGIAQLVDMLSNFIANANLESSDDDEDEEEDAQQPETEPAQAEPPQAEAADHSVIALDPTVINATTIPELADEISSAYVVAAPEENETAAEPHAPAQTESKPATGFQSLGSTYAYGAKRFIPTTNQHRPNGEPEHTAQPEN